ncbi:MAG: MaoC family dehydratase [Haloarculaceae archaeon]
MVRSVREVGENRYREEYGRYYEDFAVGDIYEHRPNRTITAVDNYWFTLLTMNNHPLHFDAEYAADTEWGQELVNSLLTISVVHGMTVSDVSYKGIANLGWEEVRLTNPVFHGDTLTAESEVVEKRESSSREGQGIVTVRTTGYKQSGEKVIEFKRSVLVPFREAVED